MFESISRRGFLGLAPFVPFAFQTQSAAPPAVTAVPGAFPAQDPDLVKEMVGVSHGNLPRVKELVSARPALARASWDWGYGDWEAAIDAASHVGNRPIAEYLIANGARPTIYTAAMMGQLSVVKGWIEAIPGVQRNRGPHGITLLAHARNGGAAAADVLKYLESLGDADPRYTDLPVGEADQAAIAGEYAFGTGATERLKVAKNARGILTIQRPGYSERNLAHQGALAFIPVGAEAVRIRFEVADGKSQALTVEDGPVVVRAKRMS
jgi:uncharacterized protein YaiE (UPF0345 family)